MSTKYKFKIKGHLDEKYADWFGRLHFEQTADGNTLLTGMIPDQAALHGVLSCCRDLGLTLISVNPVSETFESNY